MTAARGPKGEAALARGRSDRGDASDRWATPSETLADTLALCGVRRWALDAAASPGSAVAELWYGPEALDPMHRDALALPRWQGGSGAVWCNPPYRLARPFAERCADEADEGGRAVALLVYARTDTALFHGVVARRAACIWFRRGRIRFVDPDTGARGESAPAPSMLVLFDGRERHPATYDAVARDALRAAESSGRWWRAR